MADSSNTPGLARSLFALAAVGCSFPAIAGIPSETFRSLAVGPLRLGMAPADIDAIIRSRTDLSEPGGGLHRSFDCDNLFSDTGRDTYDDDRQPQAPSHYHFDDEAQRQYQADFISTPTGAEAETVRYREYRKDGSWATYLAEAEVRYGKADYITIGSYGGMTAGWCEASEKQCSAKDRSQSRLTLEWIPRHEDQVEDGDTLDLQLEEGSDREDERYESHEGLSARDLNEAKRLDVQCRKARGKYRSEESLERHFATIVNLPRAAAPIWNPRSIPSGVFEALGINVKRAFAQGTCFQSGVWIEFPGCTDYSAIGFRWARRADDIWVVALKFGGVSLRRRYYAVRKDATGTFRRIWWDESIAPYAAWLAAGAKPMVEDPK